MKKYLVTEDTDDYGTHEIGRAALPPGAKVLTRGEVETSILKHFWGDEGISLELILDELFGEVEE